MEADLTLYGDHGLIFWLRGVARRTANMKPVMEEIGMSMLADERRLFETSGRSAGSPWKPLSVETIATKRRRGYPLPTKPLIATGNLMLGLSEKGHPDNIFNATRSSIYIGTKNPLAAIHDEGYHNQRADEEVPERHVLNLGDKAVHKYTEMVSNYLFDEGIHIA